MEEKWGLLKMCDRSVGRRRGFKKDRAGAATGGIAFEVGRELLEFGQVVGFVADPDLTEVAVIGCRRGVSGVWAGLYGELPAMRPLDGEWLRNETQLDRLDAAADGC